LSESFSPSTLKDKWVKIRLAIAYARLNRIESALAAIQRVVEPEAGEVYYLAAKHFIGQQDEKQALDQMAPLKACGSLDLVPEIESLEDTVAPEKVRRKRLYVAVAQYRRKRTAADDPGNKKECLGRRYGRVVGRIGPDAAHG
jgi:hypothetical protein